MNFGEVTPPKLKASVAIFIQDPVTKLILSVSRKDDRTKWSLPGGKVDPGETLVQAIVRETYEEAGIHILDPTPIHRRSIGAGGYDCTTFITDKYEGIPQKIFAHEGDVAWKDWKTLLEGPFGVYYAKLREVIEQRNSTQI